MAPFLDINQHHLALIAFYVVISDEFKEFLAAFFGRISLFSIIITERNIRYEKV